MTSPEHLLTRKIIIISGPTAMGKTDLAIFIAKKYSLPVLNFDSLLFYREISIGTAKPTNEERQGVPHHFVGFRSIQNPMNASQYRELALAKILELQSQRICPILVGGSGFYLQALLNGMYDSPSTPKEILEKSEILYRLEGIDPFLKLLKQYDPLSFDRYHENDHYRIRRAIEHYWHTGSPFSLAREQKSLQTHCSPQYIYNWEILHLYLNISPTDHWPIIEKRTLTMIQQGLIEEVQELLKQGYDSKLKPLQSIGYKQVLEYLEGKINSKQELIEKINIATRQLAKAQRTWFKSRQKEEFHPLEQKQECLDKIEDFLNC